MPARRRTDLAARSIRFGRLDRALDRLDRERAENAIHAVVTARRARVVWAGDLVEAVELVAARRSHHLVVPPRAREWRVSSPRIRDSEESRIANVARIDRLILRAARHSAAARVPVEERLAFRTSIPSATLVSELALSSVRADRRSTTTEAHALASELSRAAVLAIWCVEGGNVVAVPRPNVSVVGGEPHALDRPAVRWDRGGLWFWEGIWIPGRLAERRSELALTDVLEERNVERRRLLVEAVGFEALARAAGGGEPAQQDDYGRLWRLGRLLDDEELVTVEVVNSTPEPDGSYRHYFLRVPPDIETARAAVAWTFEMNAGDYTVAAQS